MSHAGIKRVTLNYLTPSSSDFLVVGVIIAKRSPKSFKSKKGTVSKLFNIFYNIIHLFNIKTSHNFFIIIICSYVSLTKIKLCLCSKLCMGRPLHLLCHYFLITVTNMLLHSLFINFCLV